ncbi:predicted protein [Botrytis cinerea T4]|uniref:Uncharacterized protein n=1 Tax=Botryotinia fuckeliana (strain T4) TaxID=999810 RepID=G2XZJ3_BOTF4|nr:predicted protein [Botrytis cinerea T4]
MFTQVRGTSSFLPDVWYYPKQGFLKMCFIRRNDPRVSHVSFLIAKMSTL